MVTNQYPEFLAFVEDKGWSQLGPDSIAKKLPGASRSAIDAVLRGKPIQRRSSYLLWLATGEKLACFEVESTQLEKWMWKNKQTPTTLAKLIKDKTGTKMYVNTLESISRSPNRPTSANCALIYQATGLDFFQPEEDAVTATKRVLDQSRSSVETTPSEALQPEAEPDRVTILFRLYQELGAIFGKGSSAVEFVDAFEALITVLKALRKTTPEQREVLIRQIGGSRFAYWVSMLSAFADPEQFEMWGKMSDHSLGGK